MAMGLWVWPGFARFRFVVDLVGATAICWLGRYGHFIDVEYGCSDSFLRGLGLHHVGEESLLGPWGDRGNCGGYG